MMFEEYIKENRKEFTEKVNDISNELGIKADWLMFVMWFESKLNPQAVNPISGACVDAETEILTTRGWRRHSDVFIGDDIWSFNKETGGIERDTILAKIEKMSSDVWHSKSRSFESVSTGDHRWVLVEKNYNMGGGYGKTRLKVKTTKELTELKSSYRYSIPHNAIEDNSAERLINLPVTPETAFYILLGLIIGDGHVSELKCELNASEKGNKGEVELIRECNSILGLDVYEYDSGHCLRWRYKAPFADMIRACLVRDRSIDKNKACVKKLNDSFLHNLNKDIAAAVLKGLMFSDGCFYDVFPSTLSFRNTECGIIDDFMQIAFIAGYNPRLSEAEYFSNDGFGERNKTVKTVRLRKSLNTSCNKTQLKHTKLEGEHFVWCPQTGNETFIARRNGNVYITHNCGLIQFMPSTARSLGTTTAVLKRMNNVQQLDYVLAYLRPYRGKMKRWIDVYLAVFYPKAMGNPNFVITSDIVAKQNRIFDLNRDSDITVKEIETALRKSIPEQYKKYYV